MVLSKLNHQDICKIHNIVEVGETDFLILEYIDGATLNLSSIRNQSYPRKLRLARSILDGLVAAHIEGIIHRDLKPDNIIVTSSDSVKILDFGISTSTSNVISGDGAPADENLASPRTTTEHSGVIVGTLGYLSPEQAKGEKISTASDIYSLGIIFQEIFSGASAHANDSSQTELLERGKRGESESLKNLSADLSQLIARMKSLKPGSRPTAIDTRALLDRIIEKPKRRLKQYAVAGLALIFVLGFSKYTYDLNHQKLEAENARGLAIRSQQDAEQVTTFLQGMFEASDPYSPNASTMTVEQMLKDGANRIDEELANQPLALIRLKMVIGEIFKKQGLYKEAQLQYDQIEHLFETLGISDVELRIALLDKISSLEYQTGKFDEMYQTVTELQSLAIENDLADTPIYLESEYNLSAYYYEKGELDQSSRRFEELLLTYKLNPDKHNIEIAYIYNFLGLIASGRDDNTLALSYIRDGISVLSPDLSEDLEIRVTLYGNLAAINYRLKNFSESIEHSKKLIVLQQQLLGKNHPLLSIVYDNLSRAYCAIGDIKNCDELNLLALKIYEDSDLQNSADYAVMLGSRANILTRNSGDDREAERLLIQSIAIFENVFGEKHIYIADTLLSLGYLYLDRNDLTQARDKILASITMSDDLARPTIKFVVDAWKTLAEIYAKRGETDLELQIYITLLDKLKSQDPVNENSIEDIQERIEKLR